MGKVLAFIRRERKVAAAAQRGIGAPGLAADIVEIVNDRALSDASRRWILQSMLMLMDRQIEEYRREAEKAESRLRSVVETAEAEIAATCREHRSGLRGIARLLRSVTGSGGAGEHECAGKGSESTTKAGLEAV